MDKDDPYKREDSALDDTALFDFIASSNLNTDSDFDKLLTVFWSTHKESDADIVVDVFKND